MIDSPIINHANFYVSLLKVIVGELCNFVAYSFAPAILVTPLGALSVVIRYGSCYNNNREEGRIIEGFNNSLLTPINPTPLIAQCSTVILFPQGTSQFSRQSWLCTMHFGRSGYCVTCT